MNYIETSHKVMRDGAGNQYVGIFAKEMDEDGNARGPELYCGIVKPDDLYISPDKDEWAHNGEDQIMLLVGTVEKVLAVANEAND